MCFVSLPATVTYLNVYLDRTCTGGVTVLPQKKKNAQFSYNDELQQDQEVIIRRSMIPRLAINSASSDKYNLQL